MDRHIVTRRRLIQGSAALVSLGLLAGCVSAAKPADLPVERPAIFTLIINLKTAQALGLTIPPSVLAQATQLIQ